MKYIIIYILFLSFFSTDAQEYSSHLFETDDLRFIVTADCKIKAYEGQFVKDSDSPSLIEELTVSVVGRDPAGNYVAGIGSVYEDSTAVYQPGLLLRTDEVFYLDKVYAVTRADLLQHFYDYQDDGIVDERLESIYSWPGKGNRFFTEYYEEIDLAEYIESGRPLAPFHDRNANGIYEPDLGDLPMYSLGVLFELEIIPEYLTWSSMILEGSVAVHLTTYSIACEEESINNTTFYTDYNALNIGVPDINCVGVATCADLTGEEEFLSTFPSGETYVVMDSDKEDFGAYVQNQLLTTSYTGVTDRDCDVLQFDVQSKSRFDNTLATFMPSQPEKHLGEASSFEEYWRVIYQSLWPDGTPVTSGGDGYNITDTARLNYIFQGDLRESTDWNEYSTNGVTGVKDRVYASVVSSVLQAQGQSSSTLTSHSFLSQSSRSAVYDQSKTLRDFTYTFVFNSERWQYSELCNKSVSTEAPVDGRESLSPNPTSGVVRLHYLAKSVRVVDASGRSLLVKNNVSTIDLTSLPAAVYFLIVETDTSMYMFKVVKL